MSMCRPDRGYLSNILKWKSLDRRVQLLAVRRAAPTWKPMLGTGVVVSHVFDNTAGGTVGNASPQANWPRRIRK
jgi:hypothetical protein